MSSDPDWSLIEDASLLSRLIDGFTTKPVLGLLVVALLLLAFGFLVAGLLILV